MSIAEAAQMFFSMCESGVGWQQCSAFCKDQATFSCQADPLQSMKTIEEYTGWMKTMMSILTDGSYEVRSFAVDEERQNVSVFAVFSGTHLKGGPLPPTGKSMKTDYVYIMQFSDGKISHMTKVWNSAVALKSLGWA